jgi:hypothetical protein
MRTGTHFSLFDTRCPESRLKVATPPEVTGFTPDDVEGVVDDLFGDVVPLREAGQEPGEAAMVQPIQLLEGLTVALCNAGNELDFPGGC